MSRPISGQRVTYPKVQVSAHAHRRISAAASRSNQTLREVASALIEAKLDRSISVVPLCGICVSRDGTVSEVVDGRRMFLCASCSSAPVPDPGEIDERPRKRLITALRWNPGATFGELRDVLSVPTRDEDTTHHDRYHQALCRMVKDGTVRRVADGAIAKHWLAGAARRP
jgi:hypothetical protein